MFLFIKIIVSVISLLLINVFILSLINYQKLEAVGFEHLYLTKIFVFVVKNSQIINPI